MQYSTSPVKQLILLPSLTRSPVAYESEDHARHALQLHTSMKLNIKGYLFVLSYFMAFRHGVV